MTEHDISGQSNGELFQQVVGSDVLALDELSGRALGGNSEAQKMIRDIDDMSIDFSQKELLPPDTSSQAGEYQSIYDVLRIELQSLFIALTTAFDPKEFSKPLPKPTIHAGVTYSNRDLQRMNHGEMPNNKPFHHNE
jgi:hypothetical protein